MGGLVTAARAAHIPILVYDPAILDQNTKDPFKGRPPSVPLTSQLFDSRLPATQLFPLRVAPAI